MAKIDSAQLPEPWAQITLQSLMTEAARCFPARVFVRDCPDRETWNGVEPRTLSFDAFFKGVDFLAAQLRTLGVNPGDRVLILLANTVEVPLAILACHLAGAIPAIAPVDERVDMLRAAVERSEATTILTTARVGDIAVGEKARQVAAKVMSVRCVAGFGFDLPDGIVSLEGWSEEDVVALPAIERRQHDAGLITFARESSKPNSPLCALQRTEGQMIAEALALTAVIAPDGECGLISLMQPGAAASVAASLTLPLHAHASVQLVGPYDSMRLRHMIEAGGADRNAFLYGPDHFLAQLRPDSLGAGISIAGLLALARADGPAASLPAPGAMRASLVIDFNERGLTTLTEWPSSGALDLPTAVAHPIDGLLPEGQMMLIFGQNPDGTASWTGFGAPLLLHREDGEAAGKAA